MSILGQKIVVIGAGIGGLAVAQALALRGADVTVLEQAEAITEVGAGLQIAPNGLRVLAALGLGDAVAGAAVRGQAVSLRDTGGAEVVRLDLTRLGDSRYYFLHRADLIDILATGARDAGVKIRLLQQVAEVTPGPRPEVHLANGAHLQCDLVIGADGLHSKLRQALNGGDRPFFTRQVAWRAIVPNTVGAGPEARVHMGPGRHLVSYPLRGGEFVNLVAVEERKDWAEEGWNIRDDPAHLRAAFAGFGGDVPAMLALVDQVHLWGLFRHPVAEIWGRDNTALLGDAAHPTLPFLAQGACMALEDAWVLADCLSGHDSTAAALAAYGRKRIPRATRVINAASRNAWKYHLKPGPLRMAAHAALRLGGRVAPDRMMHQFDWLYEYDVTAG